MDKRLRAVLADRKYEVKEIGPWGGYDEQGEREPITGAALVLGFAKPTSYAMREWPLVDDRADEAPGPSYDQEMLQMAASKVTELLVHVDLQRSEVVYIEPYGDHIVITPGADLVAEATAPSGQ